MRSYVSAERIIGGNLRAAVWSQPQQGFPTAGATYAVVSPGDATLIGAPDSVTRCGTDPYGAVDAFGLPMALCGLGGFELVIDLPRNAAELSFSYVYFSADSYDDPADPYRPLDPFRVFLVARGVPTAVAESTVWLKRPPLAFLPQQDVTIDVSSFAGEQIALQFLASNEWDRALPSGALIDGLALTLSAPVSTAAVTITSPSEGDWVRGSTTFGAAATATAGVAGVAFSVDGGLPTDATGPAADDSWGATVLTTGLADGLHEVGATVVALDGLTADAQHRVTFGVDNTPPALAITSLDPGAYVKGTITLTAVANDGELNLASGLESIALTVNGRSAASCAPAVPYGRTSCSFDLDTTRLQNGDFTVTATATDAVGNVAVATVTAIADNISPAKFLVSPRPGQVAAGSVDVSVNVLDDQVHDVSCSLDGDAVFAVDVPVYSATVPLVGKVDGTHTVTCLATDLAGNGGTEAADFVVKNWTESLHPQTLSLASKGGAQSVTGYVEGPGVDVLVPLVDRIALAVPGAPPIAITAAAFGDDDGDGVPDLMVKFDRQALIDAARLAGATSRRPLRVGFTVDGREFGSALIAVLVK